MQVRRAIDADIPGIDNCLSQVLEVHAKGRPDLFRSGTRKYTDDELRKLLSGHLCRCTGYQNIFRAVKKTMLRRLGKTEEAENAYKQALQLDPKNDYALTNLSSLCFREGDYEGALDYAEEALAINAQQPQALSTAAICCGIQGYEKEYIEYYRRAVAAGYDGNKIKYTIKQLDPFNS